DRAGGAMEHRSVRAFAAAEMMPLDDAGEPAALADADDVHLVPGLELVHQHLVAGLQIAGAAVEAKFANELRSLHPGLLQMPRRRLVDAGRLDEFEQAELHRVVAVGGGRLALHHHARSGLEQSDRNHLPVRPEYLRHADLSSKNSWTHKKILKLAASYL